MGEITAKLKCREPIDLSWAKLPGMDLSSTNLAGSTFEWAYLVRMNFEGSNLREANFHKADLSAANLVRTDLSGANLSSANLNRARLHAAALEGVDLTQTNLEKAEIAGMDLSIVKGLTWEQLLNANFDDTTVLPDYLTEEDLLRLLEHAEPGIPWRQSYSGRLNSLVAELAEFRKRIKGSILRSLRMIRAEREVGETAKARDE